MNGWQMIVFFWGSFPGRCYGSFREGITCAKILHAFHLRLPEGLLLFHSENGARNHEIMKSRGEKKGGLWTRSDQVQASNGPHCLRTGTTTFGGPISHEPLPQEIVTSSHPRFQVPKMEVLTSLSCM